MMTTLVLYTAVFVLGAALLALLAVCLIERAAARRSRPTARPADPYADATALATRVLAGPVRAARWRTERAAGGSRTRTDRVCPDRALADRPLGDEVFGYRMIGGGAWRGRARVPASADTAPEPADTVLELAGTARMFSGAAGRL